MVLNTTGWTQLQKNMTKAIVVKLLHDNTITHDGVNVTEPSPNEQDVQVANPSGSIAGLTQQAIENAYDAWKTAHDAAVIEAQEIQTERDDEIEGSELKALRFAQVETKVAALSDISDVKAYLKKLTKYVISKVG